MQKALSAFVFSLILLISSIFTPYTIKAAEEAIFICASSSTPVGTVIKGEKKGGFLSWLFQREPPTYIAIECTSNKLPEPIAPPTIPTNTNSIKNVGTKNVTTISNRTTPTTREDEIRKIQNDIALARKNAEQLQKEIQAYENAQRYSQYWGKIRVSISRSRNGSSQNEIITITVPSNLPKDTRIPLSTFSIANAYGEKFTFPKATKLPMPGQPNIKGDVVLKPGDKAIFITGFSPNGLSFEINSCTGYFNQGSRFNPSIPTACPLPSKESWAYNLPRECADYVSRIRKCQTPSPLPLNMTPSCQEVIVKNTTYNACVAAHQHDADFYKNIWRIYFERNAPIFNYRYDSALLYDAEGKWVSYQKW